MRNFINNLGSLSWWLSVVIVGILINLISAYLKPRIDLSWSSFYSQWRARKSAREDFRKRTTLYRVTELRKNPHKQVLLALYLLNLKFKLIFLMIFLLLVIATTLSLDKLLQPYTMGDMMRMWLIGLLLILLGIGILLWTISCLIEIINQTLIFNKATKAFYEESTEESEQDASQPREA